MMTATGTAEWVVLDHGGGLVCLAWMILLSGDASDAGVMLAWLLEIAETGPAGPVGLN